MTEGQSAPQPIAASDLIGVINPPPEIRVIVDKTANFISMRGGLELEAKVREKERQNPKFRS